MNLSGCLDNKILTRSIYQKLNLHLPPNLDYYLDRGNRISYHFRMVCGCSQHRKPAAEETREAVPRWLTIWAIGT